jgi:predicted ribosomally synthesized peptide with SipW-like signal peptide
MKGKLILAMAAVAVSAMLIVGGTLAYFTATDSATNTFTVGNIQADLTETTWSGSGSTPSGGWGSSAALTIAPGRVINKNPELTIKANSEDCYARLVVTMPTAIYNASNLASGTTLTFAIPSGSEWSVLGTPSTSGSTTKIVYRYNGGKITKTATDKALGALYTSITVSTAADNTAMAALGTNFDIVVNAYVIQSEGFANEAAAFTGTFPAGTF